MGKPRVYGVMVDSEGKEGRSRIEFEIAKFDSDPWVKSGMQWDSDNLGEETVKYLMHNIEDAKIMTIQVKTTEDSRPNEILRRAKNLGWKANEEGILDYFQLNIKFEGAKRRSIRFEKPTIELFQPHKENNINYLLFTVKTKVNPNTNPSEL